MSARPPIRLQLRESHWKNFREISYLGLFTKISYFHEISYLRLTKISNFREISYLRLFTKICQHIAILYKNNRHLYNDQRILLIGV
jgi:hypothetical protein